MGKQDPFIQQDPSLITNINPLTQPLMGDLSAQAGNLQNAITQGQGSGANLTSLALANQFDPGAANRQFLGQAPGLQSLAASVFDPAASQALAQRASQQAIGNIAGQFGAQGPGALRSGAAAGAIAEGAINPLLAQQARQDELRGGLAGQFLGQAQGLTQQGQQFGTQAGLQGLGLAGDIFGTQAGLLGQTRGQQAGLAAPEFFNPQVANPAFDPITGKDIFGGLMGLGGAALSGLNPFG